MQGAGGSIFFVKDLPHLSGAERLFIMIKQLMSAILALLTSTVFAEEGPPKALAGQLRHIVMVQFKQTTTPEQVREIEKEFGALENKIETIIDYEWGLASTAERGLDQGFTHCFVVTFADKAGLEVYLPHEAHQAFVTLFKPQIEKLLVFDYVSQ